MAVTRFAFSWPGFEEQSIWGWDEAARTFYAQLYRNSSFGDEEPDFWLPALLGTGHTLATEAELAAAIWAVLTEALPHEYVSRRGIRAAMHPEAAGHPGLGAA